MVPVVEFDALQRCMACGTHTHIRIHKQKVRTHSHRPSHRECATLAARHRATLDQLTTATAMPSGQQQLTQLAARQAAEKITLLESQLKVRVGPQP
jgi:hypothetical protein